MCRSHRSCRETVARHITRSLEPLVCETALQTLACPPAQGRTAIQWHELSRDRAAPQVTTDSNDRTLTIATPVRDPRLLERAGWTNADVIWEQIQEAAAESERTGDYAEASELWRGALDLAREHLRPDDLRVAASVASAAVGERRIGDAVAADRMFEEALALWDAGEGWVESLQPVTLARSSTFHLRLQTRHPGGYDRFPRERYRALAGEGRAVLAARRDGLPDAFDRLDRWRRERPRGFSDWRKLLGAVLLVASDGGSG